MLFDSIRRAAEKFAAHTRGGAAIVMALLIPVLIAGLAFGSELGLWELERRKLQNAADTAAHAAATQLRQGIDDNAALTSTAKGIAEVGGYGAGDSGIALSHPPTTGAYAGNNQALNVALDHSIPRRFTSIYSRDPVAFTVRATALISNGRPACVLALAPSASSAVSVAGSTTVTLNGCDVAANSISSSAVTQSGAGELETDCISTVGGTSFQNTSNVTLNDCPAPIENGPLTPDPYRDVPEPTDPAICASNAELKNLAPNNNQTGTPLPTSGSPTSNNLGKAYCIGNNETVHGTVEFSPGVYVIKCKPPSTSCTLKVNATATLTGDGVTLFLTNGAALDINGGATIDLSAPASGPYSGLVVFFDRDDTTDSTINGGANFSLVGAVYGTNTDILFTGNTAGSGPGECTQVIGYTVAFTGNSDFDTDCSASGTKEIKTAQSIRIVE